MKPLKLAPVILLAGLFAYWIIAPPETPGPDPANIPQEYTTPTLECRQLFGDDRRFKNDPSPQVECEADRRGLFFWDHRQGDRWVNIHYNQFPDYLTGFMFRVNPGQLRIRFYDMHGNKTEAFLTVRSILKICEPPLCRRV